MKMIRRTFGSNTDHEPDLTVLMPARNAASYIEQAVRSVVESVDIDLQLLVVEDASTDSTPELLRRLQAEYPTRLVVLTSDVQLGANAAKNLGLQQVRGEFVGFVDADDYVEPERFATMMDVARRYGSDYVLDDVVSVRAGYEVDTLFASRGARTMQRSPIRPLSLADFVQYDLGIGMPIVTSRIATRVTFPVDVRHTGDFEYYFTTLARAQAAHTVNLAGYRYRRHEASMTGGWHNAMAADSRATTQRCLLTPDIDDATRTALQRRLVEVERLAAYQRIREATIARRPAAISLALRHPKALAKGMQRHLATRR